MQIPKRIFNLTLDVTDWTSFRIMQALSITEGHLKCKGDKLYIFFGQVEVY